MEYLDQRYELAAVRSRLPVYFANAILGCTVIAPAQMYKELATPTCACAAGYRGRPPSRSRLSPQGCVSCPTAARCAIERCAAVARRSVKHLYVWWRAHVAQMLTEGLSLTPPHVCQVCIFIHHTNVVISLSMPDEIDILHKATLPAPAESPWITT